MIIEEKKYIFKLSLIGINLVYDLIQEGIEENFGNVHVEVKETDDRIKNGSSIIFTVYNIDKNIFGVTHAKIFSIFNTLISRLRKGSTNSAEYELQYQLLTGFSQYISDISSTKDQDGKIARYDYFKDIVKEIDDKVADKKYIYHIYGNNGDPIYYLEFGFYKYDVYWGAVFDVVL